MINLLEETKDKITEMGHQVTDILFIGSLGSGHSCSWDEFCQLADREYGDGDGEIEVAVDLIIVFCNGGRLVRLADSRGSEGWDYVEPFEMPKEFKPISTLFLPEDHWVGLYLADLN